MSNVIDVGFNTAYKFCFTSILPATEYYVDYIPSLKTKYLS